MLLGGMLSQGRERRRWGRGVSSSSAAVRAALRRARASGIDGVGVRSFRGPRASGFGDWWRSAWARVAAQRGEAGGGHGGGVLACGEAKRRWGDPAQRPVGPGGAGGAAAWHGAGAAHARWPGRGTRGATGGLCAAAAAMAAAAQACGAGRLGRHGHGGTCARERRWRGREVQW